MLDDQLDLNKFISILGSVKRIVQKKKKRVTLVENAIELESGNESFCICLDLRHDGLFVAR